MKLIASRAYAYAGKRLKAGDAFEASRRDAKILTAIRRATPADGPLEDFHPTKVKVAPAAKRPYKRRDIKPSKRVVLEAE